MDTHLVRVQVEVTMYTPANMSEFAIGEKVTEYTKLAMREIGNHPTIEMVFVHFVDYRTSEEYQTDVGKIPYKLTEDEEWALRHQGGAGG